MRTLSTLPTKFIAVLGLLCVPILAQNFSTYTTTIQLGPHLKLGYKIQDGKVFFLVEKMAAGYVAFGLGASMVEADIVVIEKGADPTKLTIKDCKLKGRFTPICSEASEDWKWAAADSYTSTATMLKAEIMRPIAASSAAGDEDRSFMNGKNPIVYAYTTSNTLMVHDETGGYGISNIDLTIATTNANGKFASRLLTGVLVFSCLSLWI